MKNTEVDSIALRYSKLGCCLSVQKLIVTHTRTHTCKRTYTHTHTHTHTVTDTHTQTPTPTHVYMYIYAHQTVLRIGTSENVTHTRRGGSRGGHGGQFPPLSKWSMTSCAYNCQPLLCFSLANTHTSCMPRWYLLARGPEPVRQVRRPPDQCSRRVYVMMTSL